MNEWNWSDRITIEGGSRDSRSETIPLLREDPSIRSQGDKGIDRAVSLSLSSPGGLLPRVTTLNG